MKRLASRDPKASVTAGPTFLGYYGRLL